MFQFDCPRVRIPCVSFTFGEFLFPIFSPGSSSPHLSGVIRIGLLWEAGQKGGTFWVQNQFTRLKMVQFDCPRVRIPCVSFTFGEFLFPIFSPGSSSPHLSGVIRIGLLWEAGQKGGTFWVQNQFTRLKMVQFDCPRVRNPCVSSLLKSVLFPFPLLLPPFLSLG